MTKRVLAPAPTPELRAGLFHFFVFGSVGVASAYSAIWLSGKGISSEQIGVINAVPALMMLGLNVFIGRLADRARDWRTAIIVLSLVSGAVPIGFFFVNEFWGILLIWSLCTMPGGALVPIVDAATMRMTQRRGTDFGRVRAWATIGYMVSTALTGLVIARFGAAAFVPLFVALSLLRAVAAFQLPRFKAAPDAAPLETKTDGARLSAYLRPWFLLPCIGFALIQATHLFLGTMGALVWQGQGVPEELIGPLISVSAAAEAATMFLWSRIGHRWSARAMLILACAVACVRWTVMAFDPPIAVLFGLQTLHAVTLSFSYFGIMHFIANWVPEAIAAEAQGFSTTLAQGFGVVALLIFGWSIGAMGGQSFFLAAGMCVLGAGLVWLSMLLRPAHSHAEWLPQPSPPVL